MANETSRNAWNSFIEWHVGRYHQNRAKGIVTYDSLEFPIRWDRSIPLHQHLFYIFKYYIEEIQIFNTEVKIDWVKNICNCVLNSYMLALKGHMDKAVEILNNLLKWGDYIEPIPKKTDLYRLRSDKENLKGKNDFLHVPFDKIYLCNSMRFSMPGEPCLYLGYSKDVCYRELGKDCGGSLGHFVTKEDIQVVDLTLDAQKNERTNMFELWPILAACYVAPDNCNASFKEEYIFPQVLMNFIKNMECVIGLRYYSCRKADLNPFSEEYMNIALFAKTKNSKSVSIDDDYPLLESPYDENLIRILDFIQ